MALKTQIVFAAPELRFSKIIEGSKSDKTCTPCFELIVHMIKMFNVIMISDPTWNGLLFPIEKNEGLLLLLLLLLLYD